ncbi:Ubiquitin carboxyl-terminal hydrolase [Mycena indigotica]|uniref:Ubiquitin carboxyl-terminal hydrolase n=1 Tax=Mycena indigotica TaxID=2126181 RepID=A0A8H6SHW9_9AGAR|nr:Ubiquitin carboxyl-terminal hydrolase [Mycena indigotica]KAF7299258.1 Ubiquitin carboxyl-terminal hydrolase [Mycena indigotica]
MNDNRVHACGHLATVLKSSSTFLPKYRDVVSWETRRRQHIKNPTVRRKVAVPTCGACHAALYRPVVCLHCSFAGCWRSEHITTHLRQAQHSFSMDARSGAVFCIECNDFIFDPIFEDIRLSATVHVEEEQTRFQASKKARERFQRWEPSEQDTIALQKAVPISCQGRRGLLNLGQTCFMNVVLQCFVHNPMLRNYFLSDKHNNRKCKTEEDCTCCEMDKLFSEVFSGESAPFGPVTFLATTWRKSLELSGYAQHDAHEFFISTLNNIHSTSVGSTNVTCNCVVHSTFQGLLQSEVVCERCHNVTTTVDPMLDISLELKGKTGEPHGATENTLAACLRRFTQPEKLGPKQYSCAKCKAAHEVSKRLSIRKLPPVLSFQFKRFEHKTEKGAPRKIDTRIRFPETLNMAPYTSLGMKASAHANKGPAKETSSPPPLHHVLTYPGPTAMYEYDLFAVINHEGQLNNGHYTNYARFENEWYRFDDDKVVSAPLNNVLNSSAYMCFYVKRHLDYRPNEVPSYVQAREKELEKEKERERERERELERQQEKEVDDALLAML